MHSAPIRDVEAHRETPLAIIALLTAFAPIVLLYRVLAYLYASAAAWWARHRWRQSCRTLGNRMNDAEIGDQFLRDRVTDARRMLEGNARHDRRKILSAELRDAFESLGKSGAVAGVPVMGAEREYQTARKAHQARDTAAARRAAAAAKTLPQSWRGWLQLLVGCVTTSGLIYLLVQLSNFEDLTPSPAARLSRPTVPTCQPPRVVEPRR